MGRFEKLIDSWVSRLKYKKVYTTTLVSILVSYLIMLVISIVLLVPAAVALLKSGLWRIIGGVLVAVWAIAMTYVGQINIATVIRRFEDKKSNHLDIVTWVIKNKIVQMGSAVILYMITFGIIGLVAFAPLAVGIYQRSIFTILIGIIWLLVCGVGALVYSYFMWEVPIVAYKEGIVTGSLKRSFEIMRNAGWSGVGLFTIITVVDMGIAAVSEGIIQLTRLFGLGLNMNIISLGTTVILWAIIWFGAIILATLGEQVVYATGLIEIYNLSSNNNQKRNKIKTNK